jgi:hypothetical protein
MYSSLKLLTCVSKINSIWCSYIKEEIPETTTTRTWRIIARWLLVHDGSFP